MYILGVNPTSPHHTTWFSFSGQGVPAEETAGRDGSGQAKAKRQFGGLAAAWLTFAGGAMSRP